MRTVLITKIANIFNVKIEKNEDKNINRNVNQNKNYGAKELKGILSSNAYKSFGIAISTLVVFMGTYVLINGVDKSINDVTNVVKPLGPIVCTLYVKPPVENEAKAKLPKSNGGSKNVASGNKGATSQDGKGMFVPTNGEVNLAGMGNVNLPIGDGIGGLLDGLTKEIFPDLGNGKSLGNGGGSSEDDIEFQAVEFEPKVDMSKLQSLIEYPTIARKSNIEGRVIIKVLVKADGSVGKYMVEHSENITLNNAALDAVAKYGKFVPAIQNGKTVDCWISIPINFRLR